MEVEKKESQIVREICEMLYSLPIMFWRLELGKGGNGKRIKRALPSFCPRGLPDIMIIAKGSFIGLEVKKPSRRELRPEQEAVSNSFLLNGGFYYVVSSDIEAKNIIDRFLFSA